MDDMLVMPFDMKLPADAGFMWWIPDATADAPNVRCAESG